MFLRKNSFVIKESYFMIVSLLLLLMLPLKVKNYWALKPEVWQGSERKVLEKKS